MYKIMNIQPNNNITFTSKNIEIRQADKIMRNLMNEYPIRLSRDARYTLQYILSSRVEKLYTFTVSDEVLEELQHFMKRYLARYMPHRFKTLDFIV